MQEMIKDHEKAKIILGGGCFWCLEAAFKLVPGIVRVKSGYAGGTRPHPSYEQVCRGDTGHAEVVELEYNPAKIKLAKILDIFFDIHDPTTLNRQGSDVGPQYRSAIYYIDPAQKPVVDRAIEQGQKKFGRPIVTEIKLNQKFYPAENDHDDYFTRHPRQPYCQLVIAPKVAQVKKIIK